MTEVLERPRTPRQGLAGDALVLRAYQRCEWKTLALMRHGFTPERLMKLSRKMANDALRLRGGFLQDRFEDLVSRLQIVGMEAAWRYDPAVRHASYGSNGGDPFESYVCDLMQLRVDDFFRSKAEGFGDRRYGNDDKYDLSDDPDPADHDTDFLDLIDGRRLSRYQEAAQVRDANDQASLSEWMVHWLDVAAEHDLGPERYAELGGAVIGNRNRVRPPARPRDEDVSTWMQQHWAA